MDDDVVEVEPEVELVELEGLTLDPELLVVLELEVELEEGLGVGGAMLVQVLLLSILGHLSSRKMLL